MKKHSIIPYLFTILFCFYLLPFFIKDTGSGIFLLLIIIPVIIFINAVVYGKNRGFNIVYSIIVVIFFIPTIFIYYNESAIIYSFIYGIISLIGNAIGSKLQNLNQKIK